MKNKKPLRLNVKAALAVAAVSLLCLPAWRDIWIYFEYQNGSTKTVTSECISISVDRTNEPRRYSFFTIYSFHLKCGTTVAVYKDTVDQLISSNKVPEQLQALEQQFITGQPITVTYAAGMPLVNDTYALVSASDCEGVLVSASLGIAHYSERVRTIAIAICVLYGIALLFLAAPLIPYMCRKWRHRKNRIRKRKSETANSGMNRISSRSAGDILVLVNGEYVVVEKIQHELPIHFNGKTGMHYFR